MRVSGTLRQKTEWPILRQKTRWGTLKYKAIMGELRLFFPVPPYIDGFSKGWLYLLEGCLPHTLKALGSVLSITHKNKTKEEFAWSLVQSKPS